MKSGGCIISLILPPLSFVFLCYVVSAQQTGRRQRRQPCLWLGVGSERGSVRDPLMGAPQGGHFQGRCDVQGSMANCAECRILQNCERNDAKIMLAH